MVGGGDLKRHTWADMFPRPGMDIVAGIWMVGSQRDERFDARCS